MTIWEPKPCYNQNCVITSSVIKGQKCIFVFEISKFPFAKLVTALTELLVQDSPFITLCLGSTELDHVISELCYKEII